MIRDLKCKQCGFEYIVENDNVDKDYFVCRRCLKEGLRIVYNEFIRLEKEKLEEV